MVYTLAGWLKHEYIKNQNLSKGEAVKAMAVDLEASVATVYSWIKDGGYEVTVLPGEDGCLILTKTVRRIPA